MNPNQLSLRLERIVRAIQGAGGHQNDSFVISILRIQPTNIHRSSRVVLTGFLLVIGFVSGYAAPPATETEATGKTELSGVISGRVLDQSGKPIPRAKAVLYQYKNPSQRFGHMVPEQSPTITEVDGGFRFEKLAYGYYFIEIKKTDFATTLCNRTIDEGNSSSRMDILLKPPAIVKIELTDESGRPVAGASVRQIRQRGSNGENYLTQMWLRDLGVEIATSDDQGRLTLPAFPEGDILNVTIDHPSLAPIRVEDLKIAEGESTKAVMKPGVVVTLRRAPSKGAKERISSAIIDFRHTDFQRPSSIRLYEVQFDHEGAGKITVEAGDYNFLRLEHDDFYLTPTISEEITKSERLKLEPGKNVEFTFEVRRKVMARGRVINSDTGLPVKGESVLGEILDSQSEVATPDSKWSFTGWGETDENGEYSLPIAAGNARVTFYGEKLIADPEHIQFDANDDSSTQIPEIRVRSLPTIRGTVIDPDDRPVPKAVVRFRGKTRSGQHIANPVLTDDQGRFELTANYVPVDPVSKKRSFEQYIAAFDPYRPHAAKCEIRIDASEPLVLKLEPHPFDWPLTEFDVEISDWQRGIVPEEEGNKNAVITLKGRPALELDGCGWSNSEKLCLADLKGKYVLLDFWFIGCGPCHADFPSMTIAHELYKDKGLVVIGVHNNSNNLEAVRRHVNEIGLNFPVVVDQPDGRTISSYQKHGIADGYPSYVLIDPQGNVVLDDRTIPHVSLRGHKLEIVRKFLFDKKTN